MRNQLDKAGDALILMKALDRLKLLEDRPRRVLELGAGQGWASCVVKRLLPEAHVKATDLSEYAVASTQRWERIYGVQIDQRLACPSDTIPVPDASVDLVFCFAAAHHFVTHDATLREREIVVGDTVATIDRGEGREPARLCRAAYMPSGGSASNPSTDTVSEGDVPNR